MSMTTHEKDENIINYGVECTQFYFVYLNEKEEKSWCESRAVDTFNLFFAVAEYTHGRYTHGRNQRLLSSSIHPWIANIA